jgi:MYXO-CTERM domain-containing protein
MRSVKSAAILGSLLSAAVAQASPLFFESFENGNGAWHAADDNGIEIVSADSAACSTSYEHETVVYSRGRVLTNDPIPASGGNAYCLSAFVRASSDALAYLGVQQAPAGGPMDDGHWLTGPPGYENGYGDTITTIVGDDAWHWYSASITLYPETVSVGIAFQLAGSGYADFDDVALSGGPCEPAYVGADQHQVCVADAMCSADGACHSTTPPADMGGAISSNFPGGNTTLTPATPVAAEGTPLGTGPVTSEAGEYGCSMGGREGQRSFGLMMLAFVVVMLAGRRRRRV